MAFLPCRRCWHAGSWADASLRERGIRCRSPGRHGPVFRFSTDHPGGSANDLDSARIAAKATRSRERTSWQITLGIQGAI